MKIAFEFLFNRNRNISYTAIDKYLDDINFNGQIRISHEGQGIFHQSYGYKNLNQDPITYDTQFLTASIQKFITGIIIEQLIDEGKISRMDKIVKYINGLPDFITIEDLLLHISGLSPYKVHHNFYGLDQSVDMIRASGAKLPFHKFDYNDANYILLAKLIEIVENQTYRAVVYDRIIDKYQLAHSCFYDEVNDATTGLHQFDSVLIEDWHNDLDKYYGAGNMYMSLKDIDILSHLFANHLIFNKSKTEFILAPDRYNNQKYRSGISLRDNYLRLRGSLYAHDVVVYFNGTSFICVASNRESKLYQAEKILLNILNSNKYC